MPADTKGMLNDPAKVWAMIQGIDICMFVTRTSGPARGRPMSTIPMPSEDAIYLLTEARSAAAQDVAANGEVLLSYQGGGDHVCVTGTATVDGDTALVKRLWSTGAQVFWPKGPEASDVVVIRVRPARADYWDGPNPVIGAAQFLFGLVTGREPDMGERGAAQM